MNPTKSRLKSVTFEFEASSDLTEWNAVSYDVPQGNYLEIDDSTSDAARFYRLVAP